MFGKRKIILSISSIITIGLIVTAIILSIQSANQGGTNLPTFTVSFDTQGGTVIPSQEVKEGGKIAKPIDPIKKGYHLKNWFKEGIVWNFDSDSVYRDITLVAYWDYDQYKIEYNFDGGTPTEEYRTSYNIDSNFELVKATKDNVIFGGWFDENSHRIDKIVEGMTGDLSLTARWFEKLIVKNFDETRGTVLIYGEDDGKVSVETAPIDNKYHLFNGWFDENDNLLSDSPKYTFSLSNQKTTYVNAKYMTDEEENEWNINHGVIPFLNKESNKITYGMYPQDNVNDKKIVDELNKQNNTAFGNFYYYDHEYYIKKEANLYVSEKGEYLEEHSFDNGVIIEEGVNYWFKVQPIIWSILKTESSTHMLLAEKLIEVVKFYKDAEIRIIDDEQIYPNNYKYSDLRQWLNDTFVNNTFCFNNSFLKSSEVDNSASTTSDINNEYFCETTTDLVFLPSYKDYINEDYGFDSKDNISNTRSFLTTDLVRASAASYGTTENYKYRGFVWTRSPFNLKNGGKSTSKITYDGVINNAWVGSRYICIQPCINIVYSS